jgi:hypothetical protein
MNPIDVFFIVGVIGILIVFGVIAFLVRYDIAKRERAVEMAGGIPAHSWAWGSAYLINDPEARKWLEARKFEVKGRPVTRKPLHPLLVVLGGFVCLFLMCGVLGGSFLYNGYRNASLARNPIVSAPLNNVDPQADENDKVVSEGRAKDLDVPTKVSGIVTSGSEIFPAYESTGSGPVEGDNLFPEVNTFMGGEGENLVKSYILYIHADAGDVYILDRDNNVVFAASSTEGWLGAFEMCAGYHPIVDRVPYNEHTGHRNFYTAAYSIGDEENPVFIQKNVLYRYQGTSGDPTFDTTALDYILSAWTVPYEIGKPWRGEDKTVNSFYVNCAGKHEMVSGQISLIPNAVAPVVPAFVPATPTP